MCLSIEISVVSLCADTNDLSDSFLVCVSTGVPADI